MGRELALDRLTVKGNTVGPALPSFWLTSLIEMVAGPSTLATDPSPWLSLTFALTGFVRLTKNVSLGSNLVSPLTVTAPGWLVTPFFFNDTAPAEIYSPSLLDALPISVA